jgi:hypothetical protein
MRLDLDDGYTLRAETKPEVVDPATGRVISPWVLPVVKFEYRPALPEALYQYRWKYNRANSGKEQLDALAQFVTDHLVSWDVLHGGGPAAIAFERVRSVPEPILDQIFAEIAKWGPKEGDARGNS